MQNLGDCKDRIHSLSIVRVYGCRLLRSVRQRTVGIVVRLGCPSGGHLHLGVRRKTDLLELCAGGPLGVIRTLNGQGILHLMASRFASAAVRRLLPPWLSTNKAYPLRTA